MQSFGPTYVSENYQKTDAKFLQFCNLVLEERTTEFDDSITLTVSRHNQVFNVGSNKSVSLLVFSVCAVSVAM